MALCAILPLSLWERGRIESHLSSSCTEKLFPGDENTYSEPERFTLFRSNSCACVCLSVCRACLSCMSVCLLCVFLCVTLKWYTLALKDLFTLWDRWLWVSAFNFLCSVCVVSACQPDSHQAHHVICHHTHTHTHAALMLRCIWM